MSANDTDFLRRVFGAPVSAAAMAESMSLVEHTGTKWILAVPPGAWTSETHEHAKDELRHARAMANEARALRHGLDYQQVVAERDLTEAFLSATDRYLNALLKRCFRRVLASLKDPQSREDKGLVTYAVVSLLIERRLMKIYPQMMLHGITQSARTTAQRLMNDEVGHLRMVNELLEDVLQRTDSTVETYVELEAQLATDWFASLRCASLEVSNEDSPIVSGAGRALSRV